MATITRGGFSELLAPGLRKVFFEEYQYYPEEYKGVCNEKTSTRAYEEDVIIAGGGLMEKKLEGKSNIYDTIVQGNKKRHVPETWSLGFRITREAYDDDQYNVFKKLTAQLAKAAKITPDVEFGLFLDDAFSGSVYTGADGYALCYSTGHPLTTAGTYANAPSVGVDLGVTALRAASVRMEKTPDERGLITKRMPSILLVTPDGQWVAEEILKAKLAPYTNENQPNATQNILQLSFLVNHYMSNQDQWMLFAPKRDHDVQIIWREKPRFDSGDDFDTGDAKFKVTMRFAFGFTDWRGVDGSAGAA